MRTYNLFCEDIRKVSIGLVITSGAMARKHAFYMGVVT